eukprot:1045628-Pelagomonas_calceolata.AAC.4
MSRRRLFKGWTTGYVGSSCSSRQGHGVSGEILTGRGAGECQAYSGGECQGGGCQGIDEGGCLG